MALDQAAAAPEGADWPVPVGAALAAGWQVQAIECAASSIRFRLMDRRERQVTLTLGRDLQTIARSPIAPLFYERTSLPLGEFEAPARALAQRLVAAAPGGDPVGAFDFLSRQALLAGARSVAAQGGAAETPSKPTWQLRLFARAIEWTRPFKSGRLTIDAARPLPPEKMGALVEALLGDQIGTLVLRLPEGLDEPPRSTSERLPLPLAGPKRVPEDWRGESLAALVEILLARRAPLEWSYGLTEASVTQTAGLLAPAARLLREEGLPPFRLTCEVAEPGAAPAGETPLRLSALASLPEPLIRYLTKVDGIRSGGGRPRCLFIDTFTTSGLARRLEMDADAPGGTFGPKCGGCLLRDRCSGVSKGYAQHVGFDELRPLEVSGSFPPGTDAEEIVERLSWDDKLRWLLVGWPSRSVRLADVYPGQLPDVRCVLPWTRLELHEHGSYGPCCRNFMAVHAPDFPADANLQEIWSGDLFTSFRKALLTEEQPHTCRDVCPVLVGRTDRLDGLWLKGGAPELVENEIRAARAMIDGRTEPDYSPTAFNVATTSYCNYDCLMCNCGREGTLDDEKTPVFYGQLEHWLDRMNIVDANGGEPLASPNYRKFIARAAASNGPPKLAMTTNGSLMTPRWLSTLPRLPFLSITISLNAASADTYRDVNRGITWEAIRRNVDELLRLRRIGRYAGSITYSMVVLRRNMAEVRDFAEMALHDGVRVRFMLPMRELEGQTIMTSPEAMAEVATALDGIAVDLEARGMDRGAGDARAKVQVLRNRLAAGIFEAM